MRRSWARRSPDPGRQGRSGACAPGSSVPSPDVEDRILTQLETLAGDLVESASSLMLDWGGVRTLAKRVVEIGSHTLAHPILSQVPLTAAEHELRASRERLEAEIGEPVIGLAFPN